MNRMDEYIDEFIQNRPRYEKKPPLKALLTGDASYAFTSQVSYENLEYLQQNIEDSVRGYSRDKDYAIRKYREFVDFLNQIGVRVDVKFPPVPVSNSFERRMFIAKYLHDENHKIADLEDLLWVSSRTIEGDLKKLRGEDDDPIQICGKKFFIKDTERTKGHVKSASTVHPLFLTPNLTQVIVMLKGLRKMSEDPLYENYAMTAAADIWEQLSDYAKGRIRTVFSEILPEDLSWYESLEKPDKELFYTEKQCGIKNNVFLDCIKNGKDFCIEVQEGNNTVVYTGCRFIRRSGHGEFYGLETDKGPIQVQFEDVLRSAYTLEELL